MIKHLFFIIILGMVQKNNNFNGIGVYCRSPSKASTEPFFLNIINDLDYNVEFYWVNYFGDLSPTPVVIRVNTTFQLNSSFNHRWVISTSKEEYVEILLGFNALSESNKTIKMSQLLILNSDTYTAGDFDSSDDIKSNENASKTSLITTEIVSSTSTTITSSTEIKSINYIVKTNNSSDYEITESTTTSEPVKLEINWKLKKNWAMFCEFIGNDFSSVNTTAANCKITCQFTDGCTHYTWNMTNGGICWMKTGNVNKTNAFYKNDLNSLCGVIEKDMWDDKDWAKQCEFKGNNLTHVKVLKSSDCAIQCYFTNFCTHFTWSFHNNGTCWMKKGTVLKFDAVESSEETTICGIVINNNKNIPLIQTTTYVSEFDTTVEHKSVEKIKDFILYQFLEKFFLYLCGPIFIALFAFFGFLINRLTEKINNAKEKKVECETKTESEEKNKQNNCENCQSHS